MAANPRRFRAYPKENLMGPSQASSYAEGVMFTDGTVVIVWAKQWPTSIVLPARGIEALEAGVGFGGPCEIDWLDGAHG